MKSVNVKIVAVGALIARPGGLGPKTAWRNSVVAVDEQVAAQLVASNAAIMSDEPVHMARTFEPDEAAHPQLQDELDEPVFDDEQAQEVDGLEGKTIQALRAHAKQNDVQIPAGVTSKVAIIDHLRSEGL